MQVTLSSSGFLTLAKPSGHKHSCPGQSQRALGFLNRFRQPMAIGYVTVGQPRDLSVVCAQPCLYGTKSPPPDCTLPTPSNAFVMVVKRFWRRRSHRWAFADRVAWGEATPDLNTEANEAYLSVTALLTQQAVGEQVVHGDLTGNVYLDPSGVPIILDFSPYLRPRRWAMAIVFADAVLWNGADPSWSSSFATDPTDRDLFGRALIFRLVAEQVAENRRRAAHLQPYRDVLFALGSSR